MDIDSLVALAEVLSLSTQDISEQQGLVLLIAQIISGGEATMAAIDDLQAAAAALNANQTALTNSIQNAITRLSANPTAADVEAVVASLQQTAAGIQGNQASIDAIDPSVATSGVVADPNNPGGVVSHS